MTKLAKTIKQTRKFVADMNQTEFAMHMGTSVTSICAYETDKRKPSVDFLQKLVKLYNVNPNELF